MIQRIPAFGCAEQFCGVNACIRPVSPEQRRNGRIALRAGIQLTRRQREFSDDVKRWRELRLATKRYRRNLYTSFQQ